MWRVWISDSNPVFFFWEKETKQVLVGLRKQKYTKNKQNVYVSFCIFTDSAIDVPKEIKTAT